MPATSPPVETTANPRILVADDDPASCHFLGDGLRALGASVSTCADGLQALQLARSESFDLLILDCRMPGAGAREVLAALRADVAASSACARAVASSAELEAADCDALAREGFADVLAKPCGMPELRQLLARLPGAQPVLDDAAGLRASGSSATMTTLRHLLRDELAQLQQELGLPEIDRSALGERLHRLRSSCGFCGATALATETSRLQQLLRDAASTPAQAITHFRGIVQHTLAALDA